MLESNLMWALVVLNVHQLTDSKVQLNINKLNSSESIGIPRSYQRRDRGDKMAMVERVL